MSNRTDNFDRANTTNNIGTPSDGGSAWTQQSGVWGITGNLGYKSDTTSQSTCVLETSESTGDVQCTLSTIGNDGGIVTRASDDSNYILGAIDSAPQMRLFKRVAGSFTQLGSTYTGALSNGDVFKLSVNSSNNIALYQNGVSRVTATDSHNSTATKVGIRSSGSDASNFNDFSFTGAGAATARIWYYHLQQTLLTAG